MPKDTDIDWLSGDFPEPDDNKNIDKNNDKNNDVVLDDNDDNKNDDIDINDGKDKDRQWKELRQQKDKFKKEAEELSAKVAELEKNNSSAATPILDYIKEKYGDITEDSINKFISTGKERKEKLERLTEELDATKAKVREYNITNDPDWREKYQKPLQQAHKTFSLRIDDVDENGKSIAPEFFQGVRAAILNNGKEMEAGMVKAIIKQAKAKYKEKFGSEWDDAPDPVTVFKEREALIDAHRKQQESIANWEKEKEQNEQQRKIDNLNKEKQLAEANARERKAFLAAAKKNNNFIKEHSSLIDESDLLSSLDEAFKFNEDIITKDQKPTYDQLLILSAKAILFEKLKPQLEKIIKEDQAKKLRLSRNNSDTNDKSDNKDDKVDWLTAS